MVFDRCVKSYRAYIIRTKVYSDCVFSFRKMAALGKLVTVEFVLRDFAVHLPS